MGEGLAFRKGHGTGNDFVLLPAGSPDPSALQVRRLTDRRRGIGGDGVLRVVRTADATEPDVRAMAPRAEWFMDYRNADGSLAEMCGNGARLFARHLVDAGHEQPGEFLIATRGGVRRALVPAEGDIEVEIGTAELSRVRVMPQVRVGERAWPATAVFVPNPHAVVFVDDLDDAGPLHQAPEVDPAAVFPDGVNVEFVVPVGRGTSRCGCTSGGSARPCPAAPERPPSWWPPRPATRRPPRSRTSWTYRAAGCGCAATGRAS